MKENIKLGMRTIIRLNRSKIICLPQTWLETVQLDVGDYVMLEMAEDGTLIVRAFKEYEGEI